MNVFPDEKGPHNSKYSVSLKANEGVFVDCSTDPMEGTSLT